MHTLFTTSRKKGRVERFSYLLIIFFITTSWVEAQTRVFASTVVSSSNTNNASRAVDGNLGTFARVEAYSGLALGLGAYSGQLEIQFPSTLPANTTSYVKIAADGSLFNALLGGSLGNLLGSVLNLVLGGEQVIRVEARNGTTTVLSGQTDNAANFAGPNLRVVQDVAGNFYFAVKPTSSYNRIRLTNFPGAALLLGTVKRLDVFGAYTVPAAADCGSPNFTSFDGSGITLDILNLGGGVSNPGRAIDGNLNTASNINLGVLSVAASLQQNIIFEGSSQASDVAVVRLGVNSSLVNVGLLNNIEIIASNRGTVVASASASSLLSLDLLGLLQSSQVVNIPFAPGQPFDQISVRVSSLLGVNIAQGVSLFEVFRAPAAPANTTAVTNICSGQSTALTATTNSGNELLWYSSLSATTPLVVTPAGTGVTAGPLTATTTFFVAARKVGCTEESARTAITITVNPTPAAPTTTNTTPQFCSNNGSTLANIGLNESNIVWYDAPTGGNVLPNSTLLVDGTTYYAARVENGCESTSRLAVTPSVRLNQCDTDGDGVNDEQEISDGTLPNDPCSYNPTSQIFANTTSAWRLLDCDLDGLTNGEELTGIDDASTPANPNGNLSNPQIADTDNDGLNDGAEAVALTNPNNPDTDGDGVLDGTEVLTDGTNALSFCSFLPASQTVAPSAAWNAADCDNDGVLNQVDVCVLVPGNAPSGCPDEVISFKVLLQGAGSLPNAPFTLNADGLMRDDLRRLGQLPLTEPYTALGFTNVRVSGTVSPTVFNVTGPNAIVDWILVEFRRANNQVVVQQAAFVQRDGDIVDLDGVSPLSVSVIPGNYRVGIHHRNHLSIFGAQPRNFDGTPLTIDFTSESTNLFGMNPTITLNGRRYLRAGSAGANGSVMAQGNGNNRDIVLTRVLSATANVRLSNTFILIGYNSTDVNMDGRTIAQGFAADNTYILNAVVNAPDNDGQGNNFSIMSQRP
ncbi:MAG: hypothetical protein ACK4UP_03610 [Spirosomataceae bacterium]